MPQLLKAGLIRSLAAAPQARPQAPRDVRADDKFATQLDTARNSIRESRESASSERSKVRTEDDANAESKPVDEREKGRVDSASDNDNPTTEMAISEAPIVIVSIAAPVAPVAGESAQSDCQQATHGDETTDAPVLSGVQNIPGQASGQTKAGSTKGEAWSSATTEADATGVVTPINAEPEVHTWGKRTQEQSANDFAITPERPATSDTDAVDTATGGDSASQKKSVPSQAQNDDAVVVPGGAHDVKPTTVRTADQQETAKVGDTPKDGETIRDVRIHDALERALAGGSRQQQGDGEDAHRGQRDHASGSARVPGADDKTGPAHASRDAGALESPTQPTGVTETIGDVAAAAIGKFLVGLQPRSGAAALSVRADARSDVRSDSLLDQPATPVAATVSASTGAKSASTVTTRESPTTTFSQILATRLDPTSALDGTARTLAASGGSGRHQVTLRLAPAELGELRLDVRMDQGVMSLRVDADNAVAGKLIESRLGELRDALAAHGISIERAEVVVRVDASANGAFEHRSSSDDATPRHHSAHGDAGDTGWNFNNGQSAMGGDRSGRPDANPWWSAGEATNIAEGAAAADLRSEKRSWTVESGDGSIDLVA